MKILLILLLTATSLLPARGQEGITLMTYNVKYDDKNDTDNNWAVRKPWVVGLLQYHAPEIFGVQEALFHQVQDMLEGMPGYAYVGIGRDDGNQAGEYSALFYNAERFTLLRSGTFWLSENPTVVSKGWDAALPRICTYAEFRDEDDRIFVVYNAHFDHIGEESRRKSIQVIGDHLNHHFPDHPAIFMGDLNFTDTDSAYETARSLGFKDARNEATPYGPKATFNGFHWEELPVNRIDYIFLRGNIDVSTFAVHTDSRMNRYPSDHFPVQIECKLK